VFDLYHKKDLYGGSAVVLDFDKKFVKIFTNEIFNKKKSTVYVDIF